MSDSMLAAREKSNLKLKILRYHEIYKLKFLYYKITR